MHIIKKSLKPGELIIHEDFAQNYSVITNVKSWQLTGYPRETIFTEITNFPLTPNDTLSHKSFAIVLDNMNDIYAVYAFNHVILNSRRKGVPWLIETVTVRMN